MLKCQGKGISFLINHLHPCFGKDYRLPWEHSYMKISRDWVFLLWINRKSELCFKTCYWSTASSWANHFTFLCHCWVSSFIPVLPHLAMLNIPLNGFSWCEQHEQCEPLVTATVLHPEGSLRPALGSAQRDGHLERCCPGVQHSWLKTPLQGKGRCVWACDCQTGIFILASGKGTQSNTLVLKQLISGPKSQVKYFYKIEVLWSLRITDFIAQMHHNVRAIACAAKEGQCTKAAHAETSSQDTCVRALLLTPAAGDTQ